MRSRGRDVRGRAAAGGLRQLGHGRGQSAGTPSGQGPKVKIMARSLPSVGTVLVTSNGYTLYMFGPTTIER